MCLVGLLWELNALTCEVLRPCLASSEPFRRWCGSAHLVTNSNLCSSWPLLIESTGFAQGHGLPGVTVQTQTSLWSLSFSLSHSTVLQIVTSLVIYDQIWHPLPQIYHPVYTNIYQVWCSWGGRIGSLFILYALERQENGTTIGLSLFMCSETKHA